jgi:hypothetical protein
MSGVERLFINLNSCMYHITTAIPQPIKMPVRVGPGNPSLGVFVDMCWPLVAEEPHRSTILNLEHCPLKANVSCLIFPLYQGKMSSTQPLSGLDSPSQGSRGQLTSTPPYHSPPSLFPFTIGKATRALPVLALFSPYLP